MTAGDIYLGACGCCDDQGEPPFDDPGEDDGVGDGPVGENAFWWGRYSMTAVERESKLWPTGFFQEDPPGSGIYVNGPGRYKLDMITEPKLASSAGPKNIGDVSGNVTAPFLDSTGGPVWDADDDPTDYLGWQYEEMVIDGCMKGVRAGTSGYYNYGKLSFSNQFSRGAWRAILSGSPITNPNPYMVFIEVSMIGLHGSIPNGLITPNFQGADAEGGAFAPVNPVNGVWRVQGLIWSPGWQAGQSSLTPGMTVAHDYTSLLLWHSSVTPFSPGARCTYRVAYLPWGNYPTKQHLQGWEQLPA